METRGKHTVISQREKVKNGIDRQRAKRIPVNPCSFNAFTVLRTCSIHGLKQQILVVRSF